MGPDAQYVGKVGFLFNWLKRGGKKREKKHYFYLRELAFKRLLDIFLPPSPIFFIIL